MKIAISNLAWLNKEEDLIADILPQFQVQGIDIALTKIWQNPLAVSLSEIKAYRSFWQNRGISLIAMQSLLYGRSELTLFESSSQREAMFNYLSKLIEIGHHLGIKILVFGSPKQRKRGNLSPEIVEEIALSFFARIGEVVQQYDMTFCIEPNPTVYGCDFITKSQEGYELVCRVNHQGFGLHLDAAGMTLSQDSIESALTMALPKLCHFHISEPQLKVIGEGEVNHQLLAQTLKRLHYQGWTSIEMLAQSDFDNSQNVIKALKIANQYYGNPL
ncbi:MAG: TIM barrel protein [Okeania sp. SIO3B5]|uniref:sugar phosphate isomerase/epimerase family protein n=1 Tax=Okeania sp. SIO3B5 TaxID=2607811 RepID=UPI0013FE8CAE|nr:TIM barrel protein [Okeania sp. SIO3B5]NEO54789.1 TIM barrel protein [Okeania sp. SIO3B5]